MSEIQDMITAMTALVEQQEEVKRRMKPLQAELKTIRGDISELMDQFSEHLENTNQTTFFGPNFSIKLKVKKGPSKFSVEQLTAVEVPTDKIISLQEEAKKKTTSSFALSNKKTRPNNKKRKRTYNEN